MPVKFSANAGATNWFLGWSLIILKVIIQMGMNFVFL